MEQYQLLLHQETLKPTHQIIANQMWSLEQALLETNHLSDIQQEILAPIQWAMNSTYHTTLRATPGQLAFSRDMILPIASMTQWEMMLQR